MNLQSGDPLSFLHPLSEIPLVLYTRVSSDDTGEARSCDEQETDLRDDVAAYIERMREALTIVAALRDPNVSASNYAPQKDRPNWLKLLQMMRADQVKVVAFWEMSRATRRLAEWAEFSDLAAEKDIKVFLRGRMYDCRNPSDMAYLTNLITRGIEEVGHTRERVQRTKRAQAEQGRPEGKPVFGLRPLYDDRSGKLVTLVPDEEPWPRPEGLWTPAGLVREAVERVLAGESRWSICVEWNDRNIPSPRGKRWGTTSLTQILKTTSIAGRRTYRRVLIEEGGWEGIISWQEFEELQRVLAAARPHDRQRNRDAGLVYFCSSWIRCGVCGALAQPGKVAKTHIAFRCPTRPGERSGCTVRTVSVLEEHVEALVVAELSRPDVLLRFEKRVDKGQVQRDMEQLKALRAESQLVLTQSLKAGPGRLSVVELMQLRASLAEEMEQIQERLTAVQQPVPRQVRAMVEAGPGLVLARWRALTVEQKRSLLREITDSGHILPVGQVGRRKLLPGESVDLRFKGDPPFQLVA